jgi:phage shock protein A
MAEEKIGILRAIFRYFRFWNWKKARGIIRAADEQFTGSVDGISAAYDIQKDKMVVQYQGLRDAIAEVEGILEDKRQRLEDLNEEEEDLLQKREGALAMAEKEKDAGNEKEYEKHAHAFERFQSRIDEIELTQGRLQQEVKDTSLTMDKYMLQLQEFQTEIERMPQQKAEAIADYVSAKHIIELNDRLQGLESSMDKGPISAVMEANKRLTAKARISEKLSKVDVRLQDKEYEQAGRTSTARSKLDDMLAARKAEKDQKTSPKEEVADKAKDERPKI